MNDSGTEQVGVSPCPNHKNYKGKRPTKRDCDHCKKIYKAVQNKKQDKKPYRSLFSTDFNVSLFHMLSELSCYQRFGNLPPYFWRKNVPANIKAKKHYQKVYKMLLSWRKKEIKANGGTWNPIDAVNKVFYYLFLHDIDLDSLEVERTRIIPHKSVDKSNEQSSRNPIDFGEKNNVQSKFQQLKNLGDVNEQEKEE